LLQYTQVCLADSRQRSNCGITGRGRRKNRRSRNRRLAERIVLVISKIKQLVLDDRSADRSTKAVGIEPRGGSKPLQSLPRIQRIQFTVVEVFVDRTVDLIATGFNDSVENAAGCSSELRAELIFQQRELIHRVVRYSDRWSGHVVTIIINTIDIEAVVRG